MVQKAANILYVHHDGLPAGSAISLRNMLSAINSEQFNRRVLLARDGPIRRIYEGLGVSVDVLPMDRFFVIPGSRWFQRDYYDNWLAFRPNPDLEAYLREVKPHLVHVNDQPMIQAGLACARLGLPVVWHLRGTYAISRSRIQARISKYIISRIAKTMIAISEDEAAPFKNDSRVRVVYNSVDTEAVLLARKKRDIVRDELGFSNNELVIGMVGYLQTSKGAWDFIEAAGIIRRKLPNSRLRFVIVAPIPGREPRTLSWREQLGLLDATHPEDKCWDLAHRFGVDKDLLLTGYHPNPLAIMSSFDVMVSCFRLGAIGRPAFEAMAVGVPVVVTAGASGLSKVIKHKETGLVVPPGNVQAIADAVIELINDPKLRHKLSKEGIAYGQASFNAQKNAQIVMNIYDEILSEHANVLTH